MQLMLPDHQATERRKLVGLLVIFAYRTLYAIREIEYQSPIVLIVSLGTPANSEIRTALHNQHASRGPAAKAAVCEKGSPTCGHEQGVSFLSVLVGSLATLQLVESVATDFAGLHGRLAESGQILAGTDIVIDTETDLGAAVAGEAESPDPVGDEEAGGVVGGCLAGGGAETDGCEECTVVVLAVVLPVWHSGTHDIVGLGCAARSGRRGLSYNCAWESESERPRDEIMSADRIHFQQSG